MADEIFSKPLMAFLGDDVAASAEEDPFISTPPAIEEDDSGIEDTIQRLLGSIDQPVRSLPESRNIPPLARILLGLGAAANPAFGSNVAFPLLQRASQLRERNAVFGVEQENSRLNKVQALANLLSVREDREARRELTRQRIQISKQEADRKEKESEARIDRLTQMKGESDARIKQITQDLKRIPANTLAQRLEGQLRVKQRERDRLYDPITGRIRRGEEARVEEIQRALDTLEQRLDDVVGGALSGESSSPSPSPEPEKKKPRVGLFGGS